MGYVEEFTLRINLDISKIESKSRGLTDCMTIVLLSLISKTSQIVDPPESSVAKNLSPALKVCLTCNSKS